MNYKELLIKNQELLDSIKRNMPVLEGLLAEIDTDWSGPDYWYRWQHNSFKVYYAQNSIRDVVLAIKWLMPDLPLSDRFIRATMRSIDQKFSLEDNKDWDKTTKPIIDSFLHARYALEMIIRYGKELEVTPAMLPSGWAGVLYLFQIR